MAKKAKKGHILVIRLSAMGDVAMTVPAILALLQSNPNCSLTILTKRQFTPIFEAIPRAEVFAADVKGKHKGIFGLWRLFLELKTLGITHVADLHNVLRSNVLGLFFKFSGIPLVKINKGRAEKKALTQQQNKVLEPLTKTIERYFQVFVKLGFSVDSKEVYLLPKVNSDSKIQELLGENMQKTVGVAPFAAYSSKMYRLEFLEQAIRDLLDATKTRVLLFGAPNERKSLEELASKFDERVDYVAGKLTFKEELGLISNLNLMLSMDSGNGHLAANYGVPVVSLWGVTHPYAGFAPYNQPEGNALLPDRSLYPLIPTSIYGNSYPEGYEEAINTIPSDAVVAKIIEVLER